MNGFKVGDMVKVVRRKDYGGIGWNENMSKTIGKIFPVAEVGSSWSTPWCRLGDMRWVYPDDCLERPSDKMSIHFHMQDDGRTIIGVKKCGKETIKTAKSTCHSDDIFDFEKGCMIVLSRLM